MTKLFQITRPEGMATAKLDSQGNASIQYTVTNVSAREIDGRAVLVSVQPKGPDGAVEKGLVKIDGNPERHFGLDEQKDPKNSKVQTFNVKVSSKGGTGNYTFRLDTVSVEKPDEGDQGQAVNFAVAQAGEKKPCKWCIPVAVAAVVLLLVGGVVTFLLMPKKIAVPDLKGMTITDATNAITTAKLTVDPNSQFVDSDAGNADKVVTQSPEAGSKVPAGQAVHLSIGKVVTLVPDLHGKSVSDATAALAALKLSLDPNVQIVQSTPDDSNKIVTQNPAAGTRASSGQTVQVNVGAEMTSVPVLIGQAYDQAQKLLAESNLAAGLVTNQADSRFAGGIVSSQSIDPGKPVLAHTAINMSVTPKTVAVPHVTQMLVGEAIQKLTQAGLQVGTLTGDQFGQLVNSQSPAENIPVPIGSPVNLWVPSSNVCRIRLCVYRGNAFNVMFANPKLQMVQPRLQMATPLSRQ
jgi:beta-lactam-binding protein with PASTA domain